MSTVEKDYQFAPSHEWVKNNNDGTVTIGISNHAQELLGDVVFIELPEQGDEITAGEQFTLVESVKAASDVYAPVSGEIIEINEALEDSPESINQSAFVEGWIVKVKLSEPEQLENLLSYEAYNAGIEE
ncbi:MULTISPECIES: glycine cleavage system protein GcvH [Colwellia]|uniref:Glycine cleavage system H protein n=1 Tax=Colwellia psychrerythraea (strain 34H / ATCC BAA-681) TaxID=167879 RepID=Q47XG3_COLP3|nr:MULTISPECIES: glycine cleavage system protein GcvH [Colwellia]AAZ25863.1 glycine cleavage system H protein [Colwellia psychrerythraea 34H]PKH86550.1 glycine cleavage system protein H [Colwellia sp. Bg11-28]